MKAKKQMKAKTEKLRRELERHKIKEAQKEKEIKNQRVQTKEKQREKEERNRNTVNTMKLTIIFSLRNKKIKKRD
jgi:hypothetical protein